MAEGGEDIEMDDFDEGWTDTEEDTGETSFTDRDQRMIPYDTDHLTFGTNDITHVGYRINTSGDERKTDRSIINSRKKFFREELHMTVNKSDGEASKKLLEQSSISRNKKNGSVDGMWFKGENVLVRKGSKIKLSENKTDKKKSRVIKEFEGLLEEAENEHFRRLEGAVERTNNDPTTSKEVMYDIISQVGSESDRIVEEREGNLQEQARGLLTDQKAR